MFGLKNNKFDLWRGWIPIASCQLGLLIMFLLSLNCFFYVIKNSVIVNSLIAKCTSTINKAFFFFFFFFFLHNTISLYSQRDKKHGKIEIIATIADGGNAKNLFGSYFNFLFSHRIPERRNNLCPHQNVLDLADSTFHVTSV